MVIVFDIGGTNMRVASSADSKQLQKIVKAPTPKNYSEGLVLLVEHIKVLSEGQTITVIAGGVPGSLN